MRIVVRAPNWVGDCLLATTFLGLLRQKYADAHIAVLAPAKACEVFDENPAVNQVQASEGFLNDVRTLRRGRYDLGFLLPNSFSSALLFYFGGLPRRVGYDTEGRGIFLTDKISWPQQPEHRVLSYARLAASGAFLNITPQDHPVAVTLPSKPETLFPEVVGSNLVALNPCAGHPSRRWPAERYGALAGRLYRELGARIVLAGGPAQEERELTARAAAAAGVPVFNLGGKTSLKELACVLKRCRLLVTSDTAIMHLACAVETPMIVLAGAGDMRVTSPWAAQYSLINKQVYCSPCVRNYCINRAEPMLCMRSIETEEVFREAAKILNGP